MITPSSRLISTITSSTVGSRDLPLPLAHHVNIVARGGHDMVQIPQQGPVGLVDHRQAQHLEPIVFSGGSFGNRRRSPNTCSPASSSARLRV